VQLLASKTPGRRRSTKLRRPDAVVQPSEVPAQASDVLPETSSTVRVILPPRSSRKRVRVREEIEGDDEDKEKKSKKSKKARPTRKFFILLPPSRH
jgi:hypothetical protein